MLFLTPGAPRAIKVPSPHEHRAGARRRRVTAGRGARRAAVRTGAAGRRLGSGRGAAGGRRARQRIVGEVLGQLVVGIDLGLAERARVEGELVRLARRIGVVGAVPHHVPGTRGGVAGVGRVRRRVLLRAVDVQGRRAAVLRDDDVVPFAVAHEVDRIARVDGRTADAVGEERLVGPTGEGGHPAATGAGVVAKHGPPGAPAEPALDRPVRAQRTAPDRQLGADAVEARRGVPERAEHAGLAEDVAAQEVAGRVRGLVLGRRPRQLSEPPVVGEAGGRQHGVAVGVRSGRAAGHEDAVVARDGAGAVLGHQPVVVEAARLEPGKRGLDLLEGGAAERLCGGGRAVLLGRPRTRRASPWTGSAGPGRRARSSRSPRPCGPRAPREARPGSPRRTCWTRHRYR